jgi:hypothetical protein
LQNGIKIGCVCFLRPLCLYEDIFTDFGFKKLFGTECNKDLLIDFLNELLKKDEGQIIDLTYLSTEQLGRAWDFELKAVYTIGILDFIFDENKNDNEVFHHEVQLFNKVTQKVFYDKLTYVYLEMPKFKKTEDELETHFENLLIIVMKNIQIILIQHMAMVGKKK